MPVIISEVPSNKAPLKVACPDETLFPTELKLKDGTQIWRSLPQPDRIALSAVLTEEHFGKKGKKPEFDVGLIKAMALRLADVQKKHNETIAPVSQDGIPRKFAIFIGDRDATLDVRLKSGKIADYPQKAWTIRFEFAPRKAQAYGMEEFTGLLVSAVQTVTGAYKLLRDCRVSRLDVALDYAGVRPADLVVTAKNGGKRWEVFGRDGVLETLYLFGTKSPPKKKLKAPPRKPYGNLIARIYDRDRERAAMGKPPPYSHCTVTRLEVVRTRFDKPLYLEGLESLGDQFARVGLSWGRTVIKTQESHRWERYLACVRALGPLEAARVMGLPGPTVKAYAAALKKHPSDLLLPADVWKQWDMGIAVTGLAELVTKAKSVGL